MTVILAGTEKNAKNITQTLNDKGYPASFFDNADDIKDLKYGIIYIIPGKLSSGLHLINEHFILLTHSQIIIKKQ